MFKRLSDPKLYIPALGRLAFIIVHLGLKNKQQKPTLGFNGRDKAVRGS